jgi:hypothetical protein
MNKAQFIEQFKAFNELLESAVAAQNFERVARLDEARRRMLHEFTITNKPDGDRHFFEALEQCAEDNARAISKMTAEMHRVQKSTANVMRGLSGYRR